MSRPPKNPASHVRLEADWLSEPALKAVLSMLERAGHGARIVGGSVRDALLGVPVSDLDIATTALPGEVMRLAKAAGLGAHPTGFDHGTVTVVAHGTPFEVTTLRRDVETDGRRAVVAFTTDWSQDAHRRDFTINALYAGADGAIYDYTHGVADLQHHKVRFIGDPHDRIREDYLRILRFFRFTAQYGRGDPDKAGLAACTGLKDGLAKLSAERIGAEMKRLVVAPRAGEVIAEMAARSILSAATGAAPDPVIFRNVCRIEHTLGATPDAIVHLAALATDEAGARDLIERLRLSNAEADALTAALRCAAGIHPESSELDLKTLIYRNGADAFRRALVLAWARAHASVQDQTWHTRARLVERWRAPPLPFKGADVIALGVPAGVRVGKILAGFEAWWISQGFPDDPALQKSRLQALVRET